MQPGKYSLDARVVVQLRRGELDGSYTLGLMTKPPCPEGFHGQELTAAGYARQPIHFGPPETVGGARRSGARASFGNIGDAAADVRHAAIFDEDGQVVAYGLAERKSYTEGAFEVVFEPGAVRIRH
jgi:hypothetical protein